MALTGKNQQAAASAGASSGSYPPASGRTPSCHRTNRLGSRRAPSSFFLLPSSFFLLPSSFRSFGFELQGPCSAFTSWRARIRDPQTLALPARWTRGTPCDSDHVPAPRVRGGGRAHQLRIEPDRGIPKG